MGFYKGDLVKFIPDTRISPEDTTVYVVIASDDIRKCCTIRPTPPSKSRKELDSIPYDDLELYIPGL